ncbi:MAG: TrkH family potassium uptake protein [Rhodobacteraceae bacterium]|nr:TrkH family potassium uptake protein [Paracoccaceae bacterium]
MLKRILGLPFLLILMGIGAASMMLPAIHAAAIRDLHVARAFFYFSLLFLVLFAMIAVAMVHNPVRRQARSHLIALLATYSVLPLMLAVPFFEAVGNTTFANSYFEMVSSLTTTGATLFEPDRLPPSVHLWRAQVGWMGGFFVWVTSVAVLAPLNLGGFEVRSTAEIGQTVSGLTQIARVADPSERLTRFAGQLFPIYAGLTGIVWVGLTIAGEAPLVAVSHAMSTLSTSAISPIGGTAEGQGGFAGEALVWIFLIFALSRLTYASEERSENWRSLSDDPELRLGLGLVVILPILLFVRHWLGAFEVDEAANVADGLQALWGGAFTVMSFLTTTGFESQYWSAAQDWSGLETPGLTLMGLALFGGGVATTAGGVKLLRVYALYKHGLREMEKLVHPNSIGGSGQVARRIRKQGAYVAWIFFMLFAMSIALLMAGFSLTGLDFEAALVLTIAALTTTGPLVEVAAAQPVDLAQISGVAQGIFIAAMVLGRLETLAIIALLNPDFWRG